MNRVIKFRGKRLLDKEKWIIGSPTLVQDADGVWLEDDDLNVDLVMPETVGQYTGLKDRNGKEIYDGDLIEYCSGVDSFGAIWQTVRIEYRANEGGYVGINQYRQTHDGRKIVQNIVRCLNMCIVCGNIHDNSELLEGGAE